jgi:hypothetical protein
MAFLCDIRLQINDRIMATLWHENSKMLMRNSLAYCYIYR